MDDGRTSVYCTTTNMYNKTDNCKINYLHHISASVQLNTVYTHCNQSNLFDINTL